MASNGTWVIVYKRWNCDLCAHLDHKPGVLAAYDGKTVMGPWAGMCEPHKQSHGVPGVGTGIAQRLIYRDVEGVEDTPMPDEVATSND